jgi:hypothetical protein
MATNKQNVRQKAEWKALNYLIDKGFIVEEESLKDIKSGRELTQVVAIYTRRHPDVMRGKGNAFNRMISYINSSTKGGKKGSLRGISALINELVMSGKLGSGAQKKQSKQQRKQSDLLKAAKKLAGMKSVQQAEAFARFTNVNQGIKYSAKTYNLFAKPFLEDNGVVQWSNIASMLDNIKSSGISGPQLWGPTRLALRQLQFLIQNKMNALSGIVQYSPDTLNTGTKEMAVQLKSLVKDFLDGCIAAFEAIKNSGNYNTGATISDSTQISIPDASGVAQDQFSIADLKAMNVDTKDQVQSFLADLNKLFANSSNFANAGDGKFVNIRRDMATKQTLYGRQLFQDLSDKGGEGVIPKESLTSQMLLAAQSLDNLRTEGKIDSSQYNILRKKWYKFADAIRSLKVPENLGMSSFNSGSVGLATVVYEYAILNKHISNYISEIGSAAKLDAILQEPSIKDVSRSKLLAQLQADFNAVKGNANATVQEEEKAFASQASSKIASIKAMKAVNALSNAIYSIEQTKSDKETRIIVARLYLNQAFGEGWPLAKLLGTVVGVKSFKQAAQAQMTGFIKMNNPAHLKMQINSSFAVEPTFYELSPLNAPAIATQVLAAAEKFYKVKTLVGVKKISFVGIETPVSQDPRVVLASLPSAVQRLSEDHVKARVGAIQRYLQTLMTKYQRLMSAVNVSGVKVGGAQTTQSAVFNSHLEIFKKSLADAKFDSTFKNNQISSVNGLHLVGFVTDIMKEAASGVKSAVGGAGLPYSSVPYALIAAYDLLAEPVFRGDTFYPPTISGAGNDADPFKGAFQGQSQAARNKYAAQKGWLTQEQGVNYLTSRRTVSALGEDVFYPWNPAQAADLRGRYFISLYPFKLAGEMKTYFDANMAVLRGDTPVTQATPQAAGLADMAASYSKS